ncbi:MAG: class I SAM-dependent methyltransferase, partial [Candidatus Hodarchaeota archaeon]
HFGLRMYAVHGDGCVLPFKDDYFDAAFSTNFFEHVRNRDLALDEQIRVLKKGGRLLVIDGNPLCPADMFMQLIWKPIKTKGKYGGFRWFFNKSKVYNGYHCEGRSGKDEDAHNIWWWQRKLSDYDNLDALEVTTTKAYQNRGSMLSTFLEPFYGSVAILAIKRF